MLIFLTTLLATLGWTFRSRHTLELENLALRHQIGVLQRSARKRPKLTAGDRLLWVWLCRLWRDGRSALAMVQPETVVAWHRAGFRLFWTWKVRRGQPGGPLIWAIVDLVGKGGHIRTVPVPEWVKSTIDLWVAAAGISAGRLFRCVCRAGKNWGDGVTERVVWHVVKQYARKLGLAQVAPHDLRRSCAKLCHASGGELDQIQFLLGHVSVQTTERYLGCKQ